jgi:hypothetical protein
MMPAALHSAPRIRAIQAAVCRAWECELAEMLSARRDRDVCEPRQVAMYLAGELTTHSLPEIGRAFERHHTTVLSSSRVVAARIDRDLVWGERVGAAKAELTELLKIAGPVPAVIDDDVRKAGARSLAKARRGANGDSVVRCCLRCRGRFRTNQDYRLCKPCRAAATANRHLEGVPA